MDTDRWVSWCVVLSTLVFGAACSSADASAGGAGGTASGSGGLVGSSGGSSAASGGATGSGGSVAAGGATSRGGSGGFASGGAAGGYAAGGTSAASGGTSGTGGAPTNVHGCYPCDRTTDCDAICGTMGGVCAPDPTVSPPRPTCGVCNQDVGCCNCSAQMPRDPPPACSATVCPDGMRCRVDDIPNVFLALSCLSGSCKADRDCTDAAAPRCCLAAPRPYEGSNFGYCAATCP